MKSIIKKVYQAHSRVSLVVILSVSLFFVALPLSACGCGIIIEPSKVPLDKGWSYGEDSSEQAYINYEKGIEKLIIGLDIQARDTGAVLVIPVPAKPEMVKADVLTERPEFYGDDVESKAKENLEDIKKALLTTQIYPNIPFFYQIYKSIESFGSMGVPGATIGFQLADSNSGITVYQHLEKEGMITEVLSAESSDALYNYLTQKGLAVQKDSIPVFKDYIKKDFSFTVAWISQSEISGSARGILISFPTNEMYYPLKPGAAYLGEGTTKTITVVGHVTPKVFDDIKNVTGVKYFYEEEVVRGTFPKEFMSHPKDFSFTKITINPKPSQLTQDLYISTHSPLRIRNAQLINLHTMSYGIFLLIIISFIATYFSLLLRFSSLRIQKNFVRLSVAGCLTIIGTIIGARMFLPDMRLKFVLFFSSFFILVLYAIINIVTSLY